MQSMNAKRVLNLSYKIHDNDLPTVSFFGHSVLYICLNEIQASWILIETVQLIKSIRGIEMKLVLF